MATNKELVLPFIEAMIASGVPAASITVLEQYPSFLGGTRINASNVPAGVKVAVHNNEDATMEYRMIPGTGVQTKFVRVLTESTALINFSLVKDHSIAGYTGALKNMTHGMQRSTRTTIHVHHASPADRDARRAGRDQVAPAPSSYDAFKVMCHGGPLDKQPAVSSSRTRRCMSSTDPVAMDIGRLGDGREARAGYEEPHARSPPRGASRPTSQRPASLGLGIADRARIQLKDVTMLTVTL